MKKEFAEILQKYDKQTKGDWNRVYHKYERVNVKVMMVKRNSAGEIISGAFYYKNSSSKNFTEYCTAFDKKANVELLNPIIESITKNSDFIKVQFAERNWWYISKEFLNTEVCLDIDIYYPHNLPRVKGQIKICGQWFMCDSDYFTNVIKHFKNFKLSNKILSEKISCVDRWVENSKRTVEHNRQMLEKAEADLKTNLAAKNSVVSAVKNITSVLDEDKLSEQKLLYELTKGSFK